MTAEEKFDRICSYIEYLIEDPQLSSAEITEKTAKKEFMTSRDLSAVFLFLTGKSVNNYIKERKMMSAYKYILDDDEFDVSIAVEISGLGDQPSFNHKFKHMFHITPKQAFERKNYSLYKKRLSWFTLPDTVTEKNTDNNSAYQDLP